MDNCRDNAEDGGNRKDLIDLAHFIVRHRGDFDQHALRRIELAPLEQHPVEEDQRNVHNNLRDFLSAWDLCGDGVHRFHAEVGPLHGNARCRDQHGPDVGVLAELHIPAKAAYCGNGTKNDVCNNHAEHHGNQN